MRRREDEIGSTQRYECFGKSLGMVKKSSGGQLSVSLVGNGACDIKVQKYEIIYYASRRLSLYSGLNRIREGWTHYQV